ncbi:hypothetical protein [Micromonospora sp. WMMD964]|uniref:hypothetical protein n=1 Tax=Micromonospora sp. WMMD964 TaxID=3016091 RepID=UPI00249B28D6|nr:hypothetical protein [Micromonospora sp. WMMD964]WFF02699.1 hypothetical protein O7616_08060 [Micromonospora sp. WMMD964]
MSNAGMSRLLAVALTGVVSVLLAACGPDDTPTNAAAEGGQDGTAFAAYQDCLRENGVTLPSADPSRSRGARPSGFPTARPSGFPTARPSASGGPGRGFPGAGQLPEGVDEATWQKAQEACGSLRPTGRPGGRGGPDGSAAPGGGRGDGRQTAYRTCLSGRGVDMDKIDASDVKTKEALTACAALSPAPTN